jgi:hypothetical protein
LVESISVDLSHPTVKSIHDLLQEVDNKHGYQLFMRHHNEFLRWIDIGAPLSTAIHETNHAIDSLLRLCEPNGNAKYYFFGEVHLSDLDWTDTTNYSIVEETIPTALKSAFRYETYITGSKEMNGNTFQILLDELNAYTGDAWFQINFAASGKTTATTQYYSAYGTFQIDGMIDFMLYLEYFLKSARLNYPDAYATIVDQPQTLAYINYIWQKAEEALEAAYPYIIADRGAQSIFFASHYGEGTSGLDRLKATYSDDALAQLDALGIAHKSYSYWSNTYFAFNYNGYSTQYILAKIRKDTPYRAFQWVKHVP